MKHRRAFGIIVGVMLVALTAVPVMAQPLTPCAFSGSVTLDVAACPGSIITVQLADGTPVATIPPEVVVTADSTYGVMIPQDIDTGKPAQGDTLNFYVDGFLGGSSTWEAGGGAAGFKTVNLAAFTGPVTRYTLTVNVSPAASGTVSLSPTQPAEGYIADTVVTLSATAAADYEFSSWGGDASGTSPTTTVTMNSAKTVTAYFESTVVPPPAETFADWLYNTFIA